MHFLTLWIWLFQVPRVSGIKQYLSVPNEKRNTFLRLTTYGLQTECTFFFLSFLLCNTVGPHQPSTFNCVVVAVVQSCPTLCNPIDCSTPGFPVLHHLLELAQTHAHWVSNVIQLSHPLLSPSPPALNLSQHQGLFKWIGSSHQVAKVLELQLQHQSFQWIFRTGFL